MPCISLRRCHVSPFADADAAFRRLLFTLLLLPMVARCCYAPRCFAMMLILMSLIRRFRFRR